MKKCPKCGKKYGDIYNRCMQCYIPLEKVGETITVQCPACNKQSELEIEPSSGIKLRCPYCSTKFEYSTSHRVNPNPRDQAENLAKNVSSGGWESAFSIASLFVSLSSLIAKMTQHL